MNNRIACPACGRSLMTYTVKKDNHNHGRPFASCRPCDKFFWLDTPEGKAMLEGRSPVKAAATTFNASASTVTSTPTAPGFLGAAVAIPVSSETEVAPTFTPGFKPSSYQQALYAAVQSGRQNLVVIAGPGSGKTTTLKNMSPYLDQERRVVALAFNKKNALDLKRVMPEWIKCMTTHSLALRNVGRAIKPKVNRDDWISDRKSWKMLDKVLGSSDAARAVKDELGAAVVQLVELTKNTLTNPTNGGLSQLADHFGVNVNGSEEVVYDLTRRVLVAGNEALDTIIDFDDMLYLCATGRVKCEQFDDILGDEVQDWNLAQIEFVKRSLAPNGRLIAVGDPNQSIYGFRGADLLAIQRLIKEVNAETLPLSLTYRMTKKHVREVNEMFPEQHLEAREDAPEGETVSIEAEQLLGMTRAGDMVVCRVNAPLVGPCFELIRNKIKATIAGRNIGDGFVSLVKKMAKRCGSQTMGDVLKTLSEYAGQEIERLQERNKNTQAALLADQVETIYALAEENCETVSDFAARVGEVFSDEVEGVVFSSVHRAKGLEAERVFILYPQLIPHPMAKQDWELAQERNILFVARTRAKHTIVLVNGDPKKRIGG